MISIIIPTLNAEKRIHRLLVSLKSQTVPCDIVVIDSSSNDGTVNIAKSNGARTIIIERGDFNHGGTRNRASREVEGDILVFLTHDAVLADDSAIENLIRPFSDDEMIGASYGRQLPHPGAGAIEAHARLFNYPSESITKNMADVSRLGIRTAFISNSFAAYRRIALFDVEGFPSDIIFGEDMFVGAKMLLAGWKIAYCAEAKVYHSHKYGYINEFKRYFDIGVFHSREQWIRKSFGQSEGEGMRFVSSELKYLWYNNPLLIPSAILRTALKLIGYKVGFFERHLPHWLKSRLSMNAPFWESKIRKGLNKC